jgi:hypothetical protein
MQESDQKPERRILIRDTSRLEREELAPGVVLWVSPVSFETFPEEPQPDSRKTP